MNECDPTLIHPRVDTGVDDCDPRVIITLGPPAEIHQILGLPAVGLLCVPPNIVTPEIICLIHSESY